MSRLAELDVDDGRDVRVATVRGELDLSNIADVSDALAAAAEEASLGLVVDLAGVRHIDSAGVRALFDLRRRLGVRRRHLALAVPPGAAIQEVLEISALGESVPVRESVDAAAEAVQAVAG